MQGVGLEVAEVPVRLVGSVLERTPVQVELGAQVAGLGEVKQLSGRE